MGILGQVRCLIVSIPDLCPLSYFNVPLECKAKPQASVVVELLFIGAPIVCRSLCLVLVYFLPVAL